MDLWHEGHRAHANIVMNRYLDESDNDDGFVLLPFFLAVRAAVRAHVTATQAETAATNRAMLSAGARSYFDLARQLLETKPAQLIAIGGLSGSGKTMVAEALAPRIGTPPGARILESDRIRKALHGVSAEVRLANAAYQPTVSARVYAELVSKTAATLSDEGCVVSDAVFDDPAHRKAIEETARRRRVDFHGFWLNADPVLLRDRVLRRQKGPSDATVEVLEAQLLRQTANIDWTEIDASHNVEQIIDQIDYRLRKPGE
jgi:predicted kinase